jgi:hypothetical protein
MLNDNALSNTQINVFYNTQLLYGPVLNGLSVSDWLFNTTKGRSEVSPDVFDDCSSQFH